MIRPYLRDLIHEHTPIMELNNNNNNNNNNSSNSNNNNNRAKWKIQLIIKNNFMSVKKDTPLYIQQVNQQKFL